MPNRNALERRASLLAQRAEHRVEALTRMLTEPSPAFQVKVSQEDQIRTYLDRREKGELKQLREANGGPFSDDQVDAYVAKMERLVAEQAPYMIAKGLQEPQDMNPQGYHPGMAAALGLDGQEPAKPPPELIRLSERYNAPKVGP